MSDRSIEPEKHDRAAGRRRLGAVRVRTYGLFLLGAVGLAPLAVFGLVAAERAQRTAVAEVRAGNVRVARSIAHALESYFRSERGLLVALAQGALQAPSAEEAQALLDAHSLSHLHIHDIALYRRDGSFFAGRARYDELAAAALAGDPARTRIEPSPDGFSFQTALAEPVVIAGRQEGAVVARVDLVGLWKPVNAVKVGKTGFIRLIGSDGELLAHGHPEERRRVFDPDKEIDAALLVGAFLGQIAENQQGEEVIASVAHVRSLDSFVVVEQSVEEAFAPVETLRRTLYAVGAIALVAAALVGLLAGGYLVRALEKLRAHTRVLARGDLDARLDTRIRLLELKALAGALDEMAGSLKEHQEQAATRERLTVFAKVAAGLAHDLKHPILSLRVAVNDVLARPDDAGARAKLESVSTAELPRLTRLVQDLRRLARTGEVQIEFLPVDPGAIAAEVAAELSRHPRFPEIEFRVLGESPPIMADAGLVRRALYNLGANAARACIEAGRDRGIVTLERSERDGLVQFEVTDNGTGIEPARLAELARNTLASTVHSTGIGLGLAVARNVAETHGGRIEAASEVGRGSTFTLILPYRAVPRPPGEMRRPSEGEEHDQHPKARAS